MTSPIETTAAGAAYSEEMRNLFAAVKGTAPVQDNQVVPVPLVDVCPVAAGIVKTEQKVKQNEAKAADDEIRKKVGTQNDEGVLIGPVTLAGRNFMAYSAPKALADAFGQADLKYKDARAILAAMPDATDYASDKELYADIESGGYQKGNWIMPPREVVTGYDGSNTLTQRFNLRALKIMRGKFLTSTAPESGVLSTVTFAPGKDPVTNRDPISFARGQCLPIRLVPMT